MQTSPEILIPHTVRDTAVDDITNKIRDGIREPNLMVTRTPADTEEAVPSAEIVVANHFSSELISDASNLEWLQVLSAGLNHIDLELLNERGVHVTSASGVHAIPIAEQVIGSMLALERSLDTAIRQHDKGRWERFRGGELHGKTIGIVGVGAIGSRIAELASAFGMDVLGIKRDLGEDRPNVDELLFVDSLHDVLSRSDFVVLSCPLNPETRDLIAGEELTTMKSSGVLINIARGGIVDESALIESLKQRTIGGAVLDVFETEPLPADSPFWDVSNAIITPHMSGSTPEYYNRCADLFLQNYEKYVAGETGGMANLVT